MTPEILAVVLERISEEAIVTGFRNVVLMQDHGAGTIVYGEVAKKLDAKYASQGIHVYFCDEIYAKFKPTRGDVLAKSTPRMIL